eukprot:COSAG06_NODE_6561_length_2881_cov_2.663911_5_plen_123_part_00
MNSLDDQDHRRQTLRCHVSPSHHRTTTTPLLLLRRFESCVRRPGRAFAATCRLAFGAAQRAVVQGVVLLPEALLVLAFAVVVDAVVLVDLRLQARKVQSTAVGRPLVIRLAAGTCRQSIDAT